MNAAALLLALTLPMQFGFEEEEGLVIGGNLKSFTVATIPYESDFLPDDPTLLGVLAARAKLEHKSGDLFLEFHPVLVATSAGAGGAGGFTQLGVAQGRPEALDLSFDLADSELGTLLFLIDRASLKLSIPHFDLTLGRQAVSFGQGFFFTPMDLVTAFSPGTLDREYKPGVDAVRAELFLGTSTRVTAVAAYGGSWDLDGAIFAGHARTNLIGIDLGLFGAWNRRDQVVGFEMATDFAGLALFGEATATFPFVDEGDDPGRPFLRAVMGAQAMIPEGNASLLLEVYAQSLGAKTPAGYLARTADPRFARGELFLMGQLYGAASLSWEIDPTLRPSLFTLANLQDGSILFGPGLGWSISEEMNLGLGGQFGIGDRPGEISLEELALGKPLPIETEFGLYPSTLFAQLSGYF